MSQPARPSPLVAVASRGHGRRWLAGLLAAGLMLGAQSVTHAQEASEPELKAAIVFNIARFTQWPAAALGAADAPFLICLSGRDDTVHAIEALEGKTLHGRIVKVVPFERGNSQPDCRLLFISRGESYRLNQLSALLASISKPMLTIADIRDFAARGGMVGLVRVDERVRFEINPREVEARGLSMSSRLLSLALIVK